LTEEHEGRIDRRGDDSVDVIRRADDSALRSIDDDREPVAARDRDPAVLRGRDARAGIELVREGIALFDLAAGGDDEQRSVVERGDQRAVAREGERYGRGVELHGDLLLAGVDGDGLRDLARLLDGDRVAAVGRHGDDPGADIDRVEDHAARDVEASEPRATLVDEDNPGGVPEDTRVGLLQARALRGLLAGELVP
jgi:hypothetical protein